MTGTIVFQSFVDGEFFAFVQGVGCVFYSVVCEDIWSEDDVGEVRILLKPIQVEFPEHLDFACNACDLADATLLHHWACPVLEAPEFVIQAPGLLTEQDVTIEVGSHE